MKKTSIILIVIIALIAIIGITCIGSYNSMVTKEEKIESSLSNLDVMLQRRSDLIPNLINTVKGYTSHENEVIDKITKARENLVNANSISEKSKENNELTDPLNALMLVVENYPDLKSSANFTQLSDELAGTENRIAVARKDYNDAVNEFNTMIKKFPKSILANIFGFDKKEYFEADDTSKEVPNVKFE